MSRYTKMKTKARKAIRFAQKAGLRMCQYNPTGAPSALKHQIVAAELCRPTSESTRESTVLQFPDGKADPLPQQQHTRS